MINILFIVLSFVAFSMPVWAEDNAQLANAEISNDEIVKPSPEAVGFSAFINTSPQPEVKPKAAKTLPPGFETLSDNSTQEKSDKDAPSGPPSLQHQWRQCAADDDCVAVVADCATWDSVNKKFFKRVMKNAGICSDSIDPGFQPLSACVNKVCQTTDKATDVSWDQMLLQQRRANK